MKIFFIGLVSLIGFLGLIWLLAANDVLLSSKILPWQEAVRRKTFEESKAYNQGMIQEIQNMQFEYIKQKDPVAKAGLRDIILHRVADYDIEKMPVDTRQFIRDLKQEVYK